LKFSNCWWVPSFLFSVQIFNSDPHTSATASYRLLPHQNHWYLCILLKASRWYQSWPKVNASKRRRTGRCHTKGFGELRGTKAWICGLSWPEKGSRISSYDSEILIDQPLMFTTLWSSQMHPPIYQVLSPSESHFMSRLAMTPQVSQIFIPPCEFIFDLKPSFSCFSFRHCFIRVIIGGCLGLAIVIAALIRAYIWFKRGLHSKHQGKVDYPNATRHWFDWFSRCSLWWLAVSSFLSPNGWWNQGRQDTQI
jgi:hypothetical protein